MNPHKKKMTLEQHEELGKKLHEISKQIGEISVLVGNSYALKTNAFKYALAAQRSVDHLRSILDNQLYIEYFRDLSKAGRDERKIYYPGSGL